MKAFSALLSLVSRAGSDATVAMQSSTNRENSTEVTQLLTMLVNSFCRAMLCISAAHIAVVRSAVSVRPSVRPSVCLSVRHVRVFCRNE